MPTFEYHGLKTDGKTVNGVITADTPRHARELLRRQRVHVTRIAPAEKPQEKKRFSLGSVLHRPKLRDLSVVTWQLATMLDAGVNLTEALQILVEQVQEKRLQTTLRDIRERVTHGSSFAEALAAHPQFFSPLYVNTARAGEASGNLGLVLGRLAEYLQRQSELRGKVSASLTYPIIMIILGIGVVTFLVTFVVPRITMMFSRMGRTVLPLPTRILVHISSFAHHEWWLILIVGISIVVGWKLLLRNPRVRLLYDDKILRVPVLGPLFRKQAISRFALTFATLLRSGLPAVEALRIVERIVDNKALANVIGAVHRSIVEGTDIATPLQQSDLFPPVVGRMIAVGEQSGRLEDLLEKLANAYEFEVEISTRRITALIEPIMIVFMATMVGFVILSILLPILEMGNIK